MNNKPWRVERSQGLMGIYYVSVSEDIINEKKDLAIVSLISAAPELLEVLKLILPLAKGYSSQRTVESSFSYILQAEQTIAKAEGISPESDIEQARRLI